MAIPKEPSDQQSGIIVTHLETSYFSSINSKQLTITSFKNEFLKVFSDENFNSLLKIEKFVASLTRDLKLQKTLPSIIDLL